MKNKIIKISWANDSDGKVINVNDAIREKDYYCPCCDEKLTMRAGNIKRKHFSHRNDSKCDPESVYHKLAKFLICYAIDENSKGNKKVKMVSKCHGCAKAHEKVIMPCIFSHALEEVPIDKYRCDVVAYLNNGNKVAIEVYHTHKVDDDKKEHLPIPWIELKSETIIEDPFLWICDDFKFKLNFCSDCIQHFKKIISICDKYNIDRSLYTPLNIPNDKEFNYIADLITCYRCKAITPVFLHNNGNEYNAPHTIKFIKTPKVRNGYFTNTCVNCGIIIGMRYVYWETTHLKNLQDLEIFRDLELENVFYEKQQWFGTKTSKQKDLNIMRSKLMGS
ncbi:TPA: competence CoiA-like family protein [Enterobacter hormaechei]|nr:competence CoiA-like family protein [Enterobacter hormaechei]HEM8723152.1 competence CoiA-like family protein [Enterobacter hormaechei]